MHYQDFDFLVILDIFGLSRWTLFFSLLKLTSFLEVIFRHFSHQISQLLFTTTVTLKIFNFYHFMVISNQFEVLWFRVLSWAANYCWVSHEPTSSNRCFHYELNFGSIGQSHPTTESTFYQAKFCSELTPPPYSRVFTIPPLVFSYN